MAPKGVTRIYPTENNESSSRSEAILLSVSVTGVLLVSIIIILAARWYLQV